MQEDRTLKGKTRRYRIFVAFNKGKKHRGYQFTEFVRRGWYEFGATFGYDYGGPVELLHLFKKPGDDWHKDEALTRCQNAFDDWLEKKYGCAPETAPDPWDTDTLPDYEALAAAQAERDAKA